MNIVVHRWKIVGLTPLLQHSAASMLNGNSESRILPPDEAAEAGCYRLSTGQLAHPSAAFVNSMLAYCSKTRATALTERKKRIAAKLVLSSGIMVAEDLVPLFHPDTEDGLTEYEVDIRTVTIKGRGRIPRARPKLQKWACYLDLPINESILDPKLVTQQLSSAGIFIGVGDFRPERSGPFGRFAVEYVGSKEASDET